MIVIYKGTVQHKLNSNVVEYGDGGGMEWSFWCHFDLVVSIPILDGQILNV